LRCLGVLALIAVALIGIGAACSSHGGDGCPTVPDTCPDASAPTFSGDVAPLFAATCQNCHAPGGQEAVLPFTTYDQIANNALMIIPQVAACRMPIAPVPPLTDEQRQTILEWFGCGAPNN
jgi:uncharacterized membrane protein